MPTFNTRSINRLSVLSTLVDATFASRRGDTKTSALLLAAAALSSRVPGLGTATSVLIRISRRLR